nr:glycerate kinase [uncultured Micrococcus sp.]
MQRIIVIPDSFKGALSSREAGSAIATGLASVTDAEVLVVPIADGGEGTSRPSWLPQGAPCDPRQSAGCSTANACPSTTD